MTQDDKTTFVSVAGKAVAWLSTAVALAITCAALAGWALNSPVMKSFGPHWIPMRLVTALCFLLSVAALVCLQVNVAARWKTVLPRVLGGIVGVVGLLSLMAYGIELKTGEEWLGGHRPFLNLFLDQDVTRMALIAAILFSLFGPVLLLLGRGGRRAADAAHLLLLPAAVLSYLVLVGYLLDVQALYRWMHLAIALNTDVAFFALCLAAFFARPDTWLMKVFMGAEAGGAMARRLLPAMLILPLVIGWLRLAGERSGLFGSDLGVALVAVTYTVSFAWILWVAARSVNRTDRRRRLAEEILRDSSERFRLLFQQAAVGIKRLDPHGHMLEVNDKLCDILGYTRRELLGLSLKDVTHGEDLAAELEQLERLFSGRISSYTIEKRSLRKDGGVIWVRVTSSLPAGVAAGAGWWISVVEDITERKRAEEAVRESERRLRTILDALPVAVFLSDSKGNVVFTNSAVGRIWGISEHVGRDRYGVYKGRWLATGKEVEPDQWALACTLASGEASVNDLVEIEGSGVGRTVISNAAFPIQGAGGQLTGVVVVTEDVTERTRAAEQVRLAKEAAERTAEELARSNQDLEQFAYVSSHDLQEPLRMVTGFMGLFEQKYGGTLDETGQKYVNFAVEGARRMQRLIDDLLSYSRVGTRAQAPAPIDTGLALQEAMANLQASIAESGAQVVAEALPTVAADGPQLAQVFQNLIGNAIKFRGDRRPEIRVDACRDGRRWVFSVKDNGIGIDPEYHEKIFVIFQRLHARAQYPGTGIGLAICKKIIERHGGRIWVQSQEGEGTTFYFTLPG